MPENLRCSRKGGGCKWRKIEAIFFVSITISTRCPTLLRSPLTLSANISRLSISSPMAPYLQILSRVFPPKIFPPFRAPRKKKHESIYRELPAPRIFRLLETFTGGDRAYRRNRYDRLRPRPLPWSYPRLKHREKGSLRFLFCATIWKLSEMWISRASRAEMNIRGFFSFFFFRRKQEFVVFLCFLTSLRN